MWFIPGLLWGAAAWLGRSFLSVGTALVGQVIVGGILTFGLSYFAINELEAGAWFIGQVKTVLASLGGGSANSVILPLATIVEALRLVDCLIVIINAHLVGLGLRMAMSFAKANALAARVT